MKKEILPSDLIQNRLNELKEKRIEKTDFIILLKSKYALLTHKDEVKNLNERIEKQALLLDLLDGIFTLNQRLYNHLKGEQK